MRISEVLEGLRIGRVLGTHGDDHDKRRDHVRESRHGTGGTSATPTVLVLLNLRSTDIDSPNLGGHGVTNR